MWLFTTHGFFSIVEKEEGDELTIRARFRADLDELRARHIPSLSPTEERVDTDYRFRARASRADVAEGLRRIANDIGYPNFKEAVRKELGPRRSRG